MERQIFGGHSVSAKRSRTEYKYVCTNAALAECGSTAALTILLLCIFIVEEISHSVILLSALILSCLFGIIMATSNADFGDFCRREGMGMSTF